MMFHSFPHLILMANKKIVPLFRDKLLSLMSSFKNVEPFTEDDIIFLREYEHVMSSVANALDRIQGEKHAYLGCLVPIITLTHSKLVELSTDGSIIHCRPLVEALISGLEKRLMRVREDKEYQLATAFHPRFKLAWLNSFPEESDYRQYTPRVREQMLIAIVEALGESTDESNEGMVEEEEEDDDPFIRELFRSSDRRMTSERSVRSKAESILLEWLDSKTVWEYSWETFLKKPVLMSLFVKYNTAIPSSAAVERFFSIGKNILRPQRCALSDSNFNTLMFLTGNKHLKLPED
jgi:hypothetical protein